MGVRLAEAVLKKGVFNRQNGERGWEEENSWLGENSYLGGSKLSVEIWHAENILHEETSGWRPAVRRTVSREKLVGGQLTEAELPKDEEPIRTGGEQLTEETRHPRTSLWGRTAAGRGSS